MPSCCRFCRNSIRLNNTSGAEQVIGQYQWVDKIYEAQVYSYGKHMLFDFIIPEPVAFLTFAMTNTPKPGADLEAPIPFTLTSFDIDEGNYALFAQLYGAEGIDVDEDERGMKFAYLCSSL